MLTQLLTISLYTSASAIIVLLIAKIALFSRHWQASHYHPMCLVYFPGIDIMFTSDSREKRQKKMQNRLTMIISVLCLYVLLAINIVR